MLQTQDTVHVGDAELYCTLNSQLDVLSVEKLLKAFVETKGTGIRKPSKSDERERERGGGGGL